MLDSPISGQDTPILYMTIKLHNIPNHVLSTSGVLQADFYARMTPYPHNVPMGIYIVLQVSLFLYHNYIVYMYLQKPLDSYKEHSHITCIMYIYDVHV